MVCPYPSDCPMDNDNEASLASRSHMWSQDVLAEAAVNKVRHLDIKLMIARLVIGWVGWGIQASVSSGKEILLKRENGTMTRTQ